MARASPRIVRRLSALWSRLATRKAHPAARSQLVLPATRLSARVTNARLVNWQIQKIFKLRVAAANVFNVQCKGNIVRCTRVHCTQLYPLQCKIGKRRVCFSTNLIIVFEPLKICVCCSALFARNSFRRLKNDIARLRWKTVIANTCKEGVAFSLLTAVNSLHFDWASCDIAQTWNING